MVKLVLQHGKIDNLDRRDHRPLKHCCAAGNLQMVQHLLEHDWVLDDACIAAGLGSESSLSVVMLMIAEHGKKLRTWL
jgi:ankyrin repeat protein